MNRYLTTKDITQCCGCSACVARCPKKCIGMTTDKDGFYVPEVLNVDACIDCGICSKACPFENPKSNDETTRFYAAYSTNEQFIMNSSSGGIFPELAAAFLKTGGMVYGAYMDDDYTLYHTGINDLSDLPKLMRSKYYQSDIRNTYHECQQDLIGGKKVLFSGVPCQIQGLKRFLGKNYDNLYTVDIICHGVPSPLMFSAYRSYLERKHSGKIVEVNFRDKTKYGWSVAMKYVIEKPNGIRKEYVYNYNLSSYLRPFLMGLLTRESCYRCPFSSLERPGDITLGDFFGYQITRPELAHKEGLSLILVNSAKGCELKAICDDAGVVLTDVTEYDVRMSGTRNLYKPTERPENRDVIYTSLHNKGIDYLIKMYFKPKLSLRQKIRYMLPDSLIVKLKSLLK